MSNVVDVTDETFDEEVLGSSGPVLVDFWAEWCQPCKRMNPIIDEISQTHPELKVVKIDADENPGLVARYGITGIPAYRVFKGGVEVGSFVGSRPKAEFEQEIVASYANV